MARFKFVENAVNVTLYGWSAEIYSKPGLSVVRFAHNGRKKYEQTFESIQAARDWVSDFWDNHNDAQQLANMLRHVDLWSDNGN